MSDKTVNVVSGFEMEASYGPCPDSPHPYLSNDHTWPKSYPYIKIMFRQGQMLDKMPETTCITSLWQILGTNVRHDVWDIVYQKKTSLHAR